MILIDYSQIAISSMFAIMSKDKQEITEDFLRHVILNSIRSIRSKFRSYGEVILAIDSPNSWRKTIFPYYKANRKKSRDESDIDWNFVHQIINKVKEEIKVNFPYKVIEIDGAEADDIIGTLVWKHQFPLMSNNNEENLLIISADKDFIQLQKYNNVRQYNPIAEKYVEGDGLAYLHEHILKGDTGDGVPNAISPDSCLVEKIRQKPMMKKRIDLLATMSEDEKEAHFEKEGFLKYYQRNKQCINLDNTPKDLKDQILLEYDKPASTGNIYKYFIEKDLKNLLSYINNF